MKKRVVLLWVGLFICTVALLAQDVPVGVVTAFKKGNSQELSKYLGDKVELVVQNRPTHTDRQKAGAEMAGFFAGNKVSDFTVNHQGKRDESSFIIGTLTTSNGSFRVNCFFRKVENQYVIHQIRIDKINE